jgi:hypothetical protein
MDREVINQPNGFRNRETSNLLLPSLAETNVVIEGGEIQSDIGKWIKVPALPGEAEATTAFLERDTIMLVLRQRNFESAPISRTRDVSLTGGAGYMARQRISAPAPRIIRTLPRSRREKIRMVRQQIAQGTYVLDKRLEAVLNRLLKDIVTSDSPATVDFPPGVR